MYNLNKTKKIRFLDTIIKKTDSFYSTVNVKISTFDAFPFLSVA